MKNPFWTSAKSYTKVCVDLIMTVFTCFIKPDPLLFPPPALGQIMLYVDGMNGLMSHSETVQWLYTLVGSKVVDSCSPQPHTSDTIFCCVYNLPK